jgi:hypothetical protein
MTGHFSTHGTAEAAAETYPKLLRRGAFLVLSFSFTFLSFYADWKKGE